MKIQYPNPRPSAGSALVITLTVVVLITILLGSYLTLVRFQNASAARAQAWNSIIPISEAGVDEALALINKGVPVVLGTNVDLTGGWKWTNSMVADGWTPFTNGITSLTRTVFGSNYYTVTIDISSGVPEINSVGFTAYTSVPWVFAMATPFLATAGVQGQQNPQGQPTLAATPLARKVKVQTSFTPLFKYALLTKLGVSSSGNSVTADAFDSGNPLYSTNGQYIASKATDGGGIATLSGAANALNFGSGTIYGHVATGAGGTVPGSLKIGDHSWLASNSGQEPGFVTQDMNAVISDVPAPTFVGQAVPAALGGVRTLTGGNYTMIGALSGKLVVTGDSTLYIPVTAGCAFLSTDSITITNGATLTMYVGCAAATLPNVVNSSGKAVNFFYLGLPTNTALTMNVNADFVGTYYCPEAVVTLGGNGSGSEQKIIGAGVSKSLSYQDLFTFHYDDALKTSGPNRGWLAKNWKEVKYH